METKKSKQANLENKKASFFQIGVVVVLSIILVAFEWTSNPSINNDIQMIQQI